MGLPRLMVLELCFVLCLCDWLGYFSNDKIDVGPNKGSPPLVLFDGKGPSYDGCAIKFDKTNKKSKVLGTLLDPLVICTLS